MRRFWNFSLPVIWTVGLSAVALLMWGGVFGLTYVENSRWGGLPLTLAAKAALSDAAWLGFGVEAYVFISLICFAFCYSMSKYSRSLEKRLVAGYAR